MLAPQGWKGEFDGWPAADAWARTVELARQADELGFESLWVFDHFTITPVPKDELTFESFSAITALAMVSQRHRLGLPGSPWRAGRRRTSAGRRPPPDQAPRLRDGFRRTR